MRANIHLLRRASSKCKHTAHFCVVDCKEGERLNYALARPHLGLRRNLKKIFNKVKKSCLHASQHPAPVEGFVQM